MNVPDFSPLLTECDNNKHVIQVKSDVVLYASKACSDDIENHCRSLGSQKILIIKLTNITSPRRQISAIYNLRTFSKQESLLKPSNTDPYFHHENLLTAQSRALGNFDDAHMRVINYVERIFGDNGNGIDHLHLVHDPPGAGKRTLVRVGREAPLDHDVCEHFLESLAMQKLVERMQNGELVSYQTANFIKNNILNNAK
ncbi:unnamed protein product, partial [Rotaria sp. Silwood2]